MGLILVGAMKLVTKLVLFSPFIALLVVLLFVIWLSHGGDQAVRGLPRTDGWGDQFVTDAQFGAIRIGMSESAAFGLLGGPGSYGHYTNLVPRNLGPGNPDLVPGPTGVIFTYDYPIRGTGDPGLDTMLNDHTTWWRICSEGHSVIGTPRVGRSDAAAGCW